MTVPVPYGLTPEMLEKATPAAKAVAGRLSFVVCDPWPWERIDIPTLFLNVAVMEAWPRFDWIWTLYHHIVHRIFEGPMLDGMDALDLDPALPDDQREALRRVRDFRNWCTDHDRQEQQLRRLFRSGQAMSNDLQQWNRNR